MTPYHFVFLPIFLTACAISLILSALAARSRGLLLPGFLLAIGVLAFWAGLFFGSDLGYRAWQAMPDPPDEAYSDAAPMGALLAGWIPGGFFCGAVFAVLRLLFPPRQDATSGGDAAASVSSSVETGNPYQASGRNQGS